MDAPLGLCGCAIQHVVYFVLSHKGFVVLGVQELLLEVFFVHAVLFEAFWESGHLEIHVAGFGRSYGETESGGQYQKGTKGKNGPSDGVAFRTFDLKTLSFLYCEFGDACLCL
jgi:hypothetical protein